MRWALCLIAVILVGCGSNPTSPSPIPSPTPAPSPTVTVSLTDTVSGAIIGSSVQSVNSFPAQLTFSVPGYIQRQTWIRSSTATVDLIPEAGFDLAFFRQLARNGHEAPGSLEPLRVLSQAPSIYLQTAGLPAATVTALEHAARNSVYEFSGRRFGVVSFETGADLRPDRAGWITVELVNEVAGTQCGRALVGLSAGHAVLNVVPRCEWNSHPIDPGTLAHEIGHAMGFWHDGERGTLMRSPRTRGTTEPSALERSHAAIAYRRQAGNRDIDVDPSSSAGISAPRLILD